MKCPVESCLTHVAGGAALCTRHREMARTLEPDYYNGSSWQVTIARIELEERKR